MIHSSKEKALRNRSSKFSKQEVDITQTPLFFPEGYEKIFIAIYFITLPYIAGVMFQYFYIADSRVEIFLPIYENSMAILIWAIGYEIIAAIMLLYIIKLAFSFHSSNGKKQFQRP